MKINVPVLMKKWRDRKSVDVPLSCLTPGRENPRLGKYMDLGEVNEQNMLALLKADPDIKVLVAQIEELGTLLNRIQVRSLGNDKYGIIEGHRRWCAWHILREKDSKKWARMPCEVVEGLTDDEEFFLMGHIHIRLNKEWDAYAKGRYLYWGIRRGLFTAKEGANYFGSKPHVVEREVKAYQTSLDYLGWLKPKNPNVREHFQMFNELMKEEGRSRSKESVLDVPERRNRLFSLLKKKEVPNSKEVRMLPDIYNNPIAKNILESGLDGCFVEALDVVKSQTPHLLPVFRVMEQAANKLEDDYHTVQDYLEDGVNTPHGEVVKNLLGVLLDLSKTNPNLKRFVRQRGNLK